ncbi:MAG: hypothetical protein HDS72_10970 [Bacteroidales bacterium]|nr:hypothetical protein [Bacteroidales bacterium]
MASKYNTVPSRWEKIKASFSSTGIVGTKLIEHYTCAPETRSFHLDLYKNIEIVCDEALLDATDKNAPVVFTDKLKAVGRRAFGPKLPRAEFYGPVPEFDPEAFAAISTNFTVFASDAHFEEFVDALRHLAPTAKVRCLEREEQARKAEIEMERIREALEKASEERRRIARIERKLKVTLTSNGGLVCWIESPIWKLPFVISEAGVKATFTFTPVEEGKESHAFSVDVPVKRLLLPVNNRRRLMDEDGHAKLYDHPDWTLDSGGQKFQRDAADIFIDPDYYDNEQYSFLKNLIYRRNTGTPHEDYHYTFPARMFSLRKGEKLELTYGSVVFDGEEFFEVNQIEIPAIDNERLTEEDFYLQAINNDSISKRGSSSDYPIYDMIAIGGKFLFLESVEISSPTQTKTLIQDYKCATNLAYEHPRTEKIKIPVDEWNREDAERFVEEFVAKRKQEDDEEKQRINKSHDTLEELYGDILKEYARKGLSPIKASQKLVEDLMSGRVRPRESSAKTVSKKTQTPPTVSAQKSESGAKTQEDYAAFNGEYAEISADLNKFDIAVAQVLKLPLDEPTFHSNRAYLESKGAWIARVHNPAAPELDFIHSLSSSTYSSALRRLSLRAFSKWNGTPTSIFISRDHKFIKGPVGMTLRSRNLIGRALEDLLGRPDKTEGHVPSKPTLLRLFIHDAGNCRTMDLLIDGDQTVKHINPQYIDKILDKEPRHVQDEVKAMQSMISNP